ncbi:hypothetical protein [Microbacterium maritypicum]
MPNTMSYTGALVITSCWCGIRLAIPDDLHSIARSKGTTVYCPLGHRFVYGDTEVERLKREAEEAKRQARYARASRDAAYDQARAAERSAAAYKGHATRLRNRIANGVCPVAGCRRHFDNVQAHIEGQHPEWAAEHPEVLA